MSVINNMQDQWNDSLKSYTAIKMDVDDQASAGNSKLISLLVDGVEKFGVDKNGIINASTEITPNITTLFNRVVDTVADMLALTPTDGDLVQTLGYATVGDDGANLYRYRSVASETIDGGVVMPGAGGSLSFDANHVFDGNAGAWLTRWLAVDMENPTAQQFGAIGEGAVDDLDPLQRFVWYVIRTSKKVQLTGIFSISDTLYIQNKSAPANGGTGWSIVMPPTAGGNAWPGRNAINYMAIGSPGIPGGQRKAIVEIHIHRNAEMDFSVRNPYDVVGMVGILWHNGPDDPQPFPKKASNHNTLSCRVSGCHVGLQLGDFTNDDYDSNIDDNYFPRVVFSGCKIDLLIDSHAQDNNIFDYFHGTTEPVDGIKENVILVKKNGNGFKIQNGFARVSGLQDDDIAIDIQAGAFSCEYFSMEGNEGGELILPLSMQTGGGGRGHSVIMNFCTTHGMHNTAGQGVYTDSRAPIIFIGCKFTGNLYHAYGITVIGCTFVTATDPADGYGIVPGAGSWAYSNSLGVGRTGAAEGSTIQDLDPFVRTRSVIPLLPATPQTTGTIFVGGINGTIYAQTSGAHTVNAPGFTNTDASICRGRTLQIWVEATGATTLTFNSSGTGYVLRGTNPVSIAAGRQRLFTFFFTGTVWLETTDTSLLADDVGMRAAIDTDVLAVVDTDVLALIHANHVVQYTSGSAGAITIPTNATVAFEIGTVIEIHQMGTGALTISPAGSVTLQSRGGLYDTAGQYAVASIRKIATDTWVFSGDVA